MEFLSLLVKDLFLPNTKTWNLNLPLINHLFFFIIKLPFRIYLRFMFQRGQKKKSSDNLVWTCTNCWTHPVKGYCVSCQDNRFKKGKGSFRNELWDLKVHQRFKLHLWRRTICGLPWRSSVDNSAHPVKLARIRIPTDAEIIHVYSDARCKGLF